MTTTPAIEDPMELISSITEFNELHDFMQDEDLTKCLAIVIKLIVRSGDVPPQKVASLIVELQAMATKFAILSSYYSNMGKSGRNEIMKKNVYYTLKESIGKLTDSLKYQVRASI